LAEGHGVVYSGSFKGCGTLGEVLEEEEAFECLVVPLDTAWVPELEAAGFWF
jgi:hypothetical protein